MNAAANQSPVFDPKFSAEALSTLASIIKVYQQPNQFAEQRDFLVQKEINKLLKKQSPKNLK